MTANLTDKARDHFRAALTQLADDVLARDDAGDRLAQLATGGLALMLTSRGLYFVPADIAANVLVELADDAEKKAADTPASYGMYL